MHARSPTGIAGRIRRLVLDESRRANVGHIGCSLSVADILAALYGGALRTTDGDPDRDRFVLSKGHAGLALYAALEATGRLPEGAVSQYCGDGTMLGVHPEHALPGVDFSTGSLGQGLSMGVGAAVAARMQGSSRRTFVLMSDAELNEGSIWEAAMFAAHHGLGSLVLLVDLNGQQALGYTKDVLDLEPVAPRFEAFGWDVREVDGHDVSAIAGVLASLDTEGGTPHVVLARTTFGKGVPYMHGRIEWHYLPLSEQQYREAVAVVEPLG